MVLRQLGNSYRPLLEFDLSFMPSGSRPAVVYDNAGARTAGAELALYQSTRQPGSWSTQLQLITVPWVSGNGPAGRRIRARS